MSLQQYYNDFSSVVSSGNLCEGLTCRGWFCSDVDTWHQCPCGKNANRHPEDDRFDAEQEVIAQSLDEQRWASFVGQWAVIARLESGSWYAIVICKEFKGAVACAKDNAPYGSTKIKRVKDIAEARNYDFQIEDMRDWATDI